MNAMKLDAKIYIQGRKDVQFFCAKFFIRLVSIVSPLLLTLALAQVRLTLYKHIQQLPNL